MYWTSGTAQIGLVAQLKSAMPFDHVPQYLATKDDEKRCNLYLRTCDLSDLTKLSQ
jgi:hypothetical protein